MAMAPSSCLLVNHNQNVQVVVFILRTVMTMLQFMQFPNHTLRILGGFFCCSEKM